MKRAFLTLAFAAGFAGAGLAAEPQITVTGEAMLERKAETFLVSISILERNKDRPASLRQAAAKFEAVKKALSKLKGLKEAAFKASDAETTAIRPSGCYRRGYSEGRSSETCAPIDYQTHIEVTIEGKPAKAAGDTVALMSDMDVEGADILGFSLADPESAKRDARAEALKKAMEQAAFLADKAGVRLGAPVRITYMAGDRYREERPTLRAAPRDRIVVTGSRLSAPSTPIDLPPGIVAVAESVSVTYELKGGR